MHKEYTRAQVLNTITDNLITTQMRQNVKLFSISQNTDCQDNGRMLDKSRPGKRISCGSTTRAYEGPREKNRPTEKISSKSSNPGRLEGPRTELPPPRHRRGGRGTGAHHRKTSSALETDGFTNLEHFSAGVPDPGPAHEHRPRPRPDVDFV